MRNKYALIVDDEPDTCWAFEHILKRRGVRSATATNGQEALRLMKLNRFQLVLLDAKLPDIDGLALARRILEIDLAIHIVMVSGYFYRDDVAIQKAFAEGLICDFISKPFHHDEILKAVEIALCR